MNLVKNELTKHYVKPNCFEKTKEAWGIFSFFSSTNVETKNVCPIADNGSWLGEVGDLKAQSLKLLLMLIKSTNEQFRTKPPILPSRC
jgi:GH25 family lysozyme M1 (1,4-beta-N-acetylmuramidase)